MDNDIIVKITPVPTTPLHPQVCQLLPARKGTQRAADEVSGHENRIYPIGGRRVDVENTGLVAELDTLHAYVYKNDTGNDTCIVVSAEKERASCKQNHSATDKVEIAYAYLFYIFSYKRCG